MGAQQRAARRYAESQLSWCDFLLIFLKICGAGGEGLRMHEGSGGVRHAAEHDDVAGRYTRGFQRSREPRSMPRMRVRTLPRKHEPCISESPSGDRCVMVEGRAAYLNAI